MQYTGTGTSDYDHESRLTDRRSAISSLNAKEAKRPSDGVPISYTSSKLTICILQPNLSIRLVSLE